MIVAFLVAAPVLNPLAVAQDCPTHGLLASLAPAPKHGAPQNAPASQKHPNHPQEFHLTNVTQLTFGGQNAEAYWSVDGTQITYQTRQPEYPDEQIITMNADGTKKTLVSTGEGRCTCSYFSPDAKHVYFSSTHEVNKGAQAPLDMSQGYLWKVNPQFSLYRRNLATNALEPILKRNAYIAETTIAADGSYMTWTSTMDGDLEIYRSNLDGTNIKRLTNNVGYDGGPFISWDGKQIVYRRDDLRTDTEINDYKRLLAENLVRPGRLDIWVMDADGGNNRRVTRLGGASFAPFLHPDGRQIIFSSNFHDPKGREFDLFVVNTDGTGLRQITFTPEFDGFPMFNREGTKLIFGSNRFGKEQGETNIFVADWVEPDVTRVKAEATDDVWLYPFATNQDSDSFLRVWGTGADLATFTEDGEDSVSLVRFPAQEIPAGDIVSARVVLTHVNPEGGQRANVRKYPIEIRSVKSGFSEKSWAHALGATHWPGPGVLGSAQFGETREDGSFEMVFEIAQVDKLRELLSDPLGPAFAFTSTAPASEVGRTGVYKFFSRNAPDAAVRPRLEITVR